MNTRSGQLAQLQVLQAQQLALEQDYLALQAEQQQQQQAASSWLQRRGDELQAEAAEQKKAETLQRIFYRIAERATANLSFYDFLQTVHSLLGQLLYARNCYVCLYDAQSNTKDFPYYVDERDGDRLQLSHVPYRRGLTEFVLRTAKPQLIDATRLAQLQASGEITEGSGDMSFTSWLGVPMQIRGVTAGVLTVQGYEPSVHYDASDADVLSFVANHVSSAIERYQALDELRKSEERYRLVIESVGVGVVVVQSGRMVFANPSMVRIVGHPLDYLLSHHYTATIHPDDVAQVVERHQRRLRNEPVETNYGFRVITQSGEIRWLDLSAVKIEWGAADAALMFVVDATVRKQAEQTRREALQKQGELNDMKSRFIAMASHEFRTPLATIHGSVELLRHYQDRLRPQQKAEALKKIDDAVRRMTRMLENVLQIGRADAGQLEFNPQALAVTRFCLGLIDELKSSMAARFDKVTLVPDLPPIDVNLWLDETLLRNILGNLLSNALKYTPDGKTVFLTVGVETDTLHISVADEGIGIPQADLPRLFDSFQRASNVGSIAGTGLGLSIVRDSVNWHKGVIEVSSQVNQGSCFSVVLPTKILPTFQQGTPS
jgi:PAS domain S-box-containing protein